MGKTTDRKPHSWGTLTNVCVCEMFDPTTGDSVPADDCYGDCYDDQLYSFGFAVSDLLERHSQFFVSGLRLWDDVYAGVFTADNVADFVRGFTVRGAWRLDYKVYDNVLEAKLYHHDAPTGCRVTVVGTSD